MDSKTKTHETPSSKKWNILKDLNQSLASLSQLSNSQINWSANYFAGCDMSQFTVLLAISTVYKDMTEDSENKIMNLIGQCIWEKWQIVNFW